MSYIEDNLMPNEKIFFIARVHPAVFLPSIVAFIMTIVFYAWNFRLIASETGASSSQISFVNPVGIFVLCFSGILFLSAIWHGILALITMLTTEFGTTNRRVIAKTGFIRRHTTELLLPKIESVSVNQNVLGRLLNFGTVTVTGTGGTKESFRAIIDPIGVRRKINRIIEGYVKHQQKLSNRQAGS